MFTPFNLTVVSISFAILIFLNPIDANPYSNIAFVSIFSSNSDCEGYADIGFDQTMDNRLGFYFLTHQCDFDFHRSKPIIDKQPLFFSNRFSD